MHVAIQQPVHYKKQWWQYKDPPFDRLDKKYRYFPESENQSKSEPFGHDAMRAWATFRLVQSPGALGWGIGQL